MEKKKKNEKGFLCRFAEYIRVAKCSHKRAYYFHDNAPQYCPDCGQYVDGGNAEEFAD